MSETLDDILAVVSKPGNRTTRIFEIIATGITILGIIGAIDILMKWLGG
jgi:preprotein translocase subunit Sss1